MHCQFGCHYQIHYQFLQGKVSRHSGEREEKDGTVQNPDDKKPKVELERLGVCMHVCVHAPVCVCIPLIQWLERQASLSYSSLLHDIFRGHLILISVLSLENLSEWPCLHNIKRSGSLGRCQMIKVLLAAVYVDHVNCKIIAFSFNHVLCPLCMLI